jgi:ABC-type Fe3+-hydroxamate transport system substrate-binding protein
MLAFWGCTSTPKINGRTTEKGLTLFGLTPAVTEIMFDVCRPEQIQMVCKAADYPAEAKTRKSISTLPLDLETLAQEQPTFVIAEEGLHTEKNLDKVRQLGITVKVLRLETIEDLYLAVDSIGVWSGNENKAQRVVQKVKADIAPYQNKLAAQNIKMGVLFFASPLMAYGPGNWLDAKLNYLGIRNAFRTYNSSFVNLSAEELATVPMNYLSAPVLTEKTELTLLTILKNRPELKLIHLNEDLASRPSTRLAAQLADICSAVEAP